MSLARFEVIRLIPQTTKRHLSRKRNEVILHIYIIYNTVVAKCVLILHHCPEVSVISNKTRVIWKAVLLMILIK